MEQMRVRVVKRGGRWGILLPAFGRLPVRCGTPQVRSTPVFLPMPREVRGSRKATVRFAGHKACFFRWARDNVGDMVLSVPEEVEYLFCLATPPDTELSIVAFISQPGMTLICFSCGELISAAQRC